MPELGIQLVIIIPAADIFVVMKMQRRRSDFFFKCLS